MESIDNYLIQIEDILESCKAVPLMGKVAVDKEMIYEIIDEMRMNMPKEIKEAKKVFENRDKYLRDAEKRALAIIEEAKKDAEEIVKDGENRAAKLTAEHEIVKTATLEAEKIIEEAKHDAKNMRINSLEYADDILAKGEHAIRVASENISKQLQSTDTYFTQVLDTLYSNRQELRDNG
ncbi:MAG: ATPase [Defluviitaleaceae bacterium]|nr:ATPase [Defluviitaleaceae bacterium]